MPDTDGNAEQTRRIIETVAKQVIDVYGVLPKAVPPGMPPFVKWFSIAIGGLGSTAPNVRNGLSIQLVVATHASKRSAGVS